MKPHIVFDGGVWLCGLTLARKSGSWTTWYGRVGTGYTPSAAWKNWVGV